MNFCCSDDYTETGSFLTDDIDIYSAFQAYLVGSSNVFPDLEEFKTRGLLKIESIDPSDINVQENDNTETEKDEEE